MYKLTLSSYLVQRVLDGASIPLDAPANRDTLAYVKWLAEGNTPEARLSAPEETLEAKQAVSAWANDKRDSQIAGTVEYNGARFDSGRESVQNLLGVVVALGAGIPLPKDFVWRSADNVNVPMSAPELISLGGLMMANVNAAYVKAWAIKDGFRKTDPNQSIASLTW